MKTLINLNRAVWLALVILIVLSFGYVTNAIAADLPWVWAENAVKKHEVWEPTTSKWVPGNPSGYVEGETAAFLVTITADPGDQQFFHICLDYDESVTGAYAFTEIEPWDTTVTPAPPLPGDVTLTDTSNPDVWAYNATIDDVVFLGRGTGPCKTSYLHWDASFTVDADSDGIVYIVYGGHLAKSGEPLPILPGEPAGTVPDGLGVSGVNGVFQARVITNSGGADKTVNFNSIPTAVTLKHFGSASPNTRWIGFAVTVAVIALMFALSAYVNLRLRKSLA